MRVRFPDQKITRPSLEHLLQNTGETPFSETVVASELFAEDLQRCAAVAFDIFATESRQSPGGRSWPAGAAFQI